MLGNTGSRLDNTKPGRMAVFLTYFVRSGYTRRKKKKKKKKKPRKLKLGVVFPLLRLNFYSLPNLSFFLISFLLSTGKKI